LRVNEGSFRFMTVLLLTLFPAGIAATTMAVAVPVHFSAPFLHGSVAVAPTGNLSTSFVETSFTPPFQPTLIYVEVPTTTTATETTTSVSTTLATETVSRETTETYTRSVTYSGATVTSGPPGSVGRYYTVPCGSNGVALIHVYEEVDENGHVVEVHELVGTVGCDERQAGGPLTNPVVVGVIGAIIGALGGVIAMKLRHVAGNKPLPRTEVA
jgi:hypothetical protein